MDNIISERLATQLAEGVVLGEGFRLLLELEQAALVANDIDALDKLIESKRFKQHELEQFERELVASLTEAGCLERGTGFWAEFRTTHSGVNENLDTVQQVLSDCQRLMAENEGILNAGLIQINQAIEALSNGHNNSPLLYTADKTQQQATIRSRDIVVA